MRRYRLLLRAFPPAWRERYGDELFALIEEQPNRRGQARDLLCAGLRERARPLASWTAAGVSAATVLISPLQRRLALTFPKRTVALLCVVVAAGCALTAVARSAPPDPVPAPPSMASSLSPTMAATPGIVAFLMSSTPKAIEINPTTGQTVWVGKGTTTWTATGEHFAPGGVTIAGTYEAPSYPGAQTTNPWPIYSPASALTAGVDN